MSILGWIQTRDTPLKRWLHARLRGLHSWEMPSSPLLYRPLLHERELRKNGWRWLKSKFYYQPLLRAHCQTSGSGLVLFDDMPKIIGNLSIFLGKHVRLEGDQVWMATGSGRACRLSVGDDSYLGYGCQIIVGTDVQIGRHVLVANRVLINGYDGHPLDPLARARNEPPDASGTGPVRLCDHSWVGSNVIILKNVTIGRGAIVATGSVVTRDVEPLTVVAGNPAEVIRRLDPPPGWVV